MNYSVDHFSVGTLDINERMLLHAIETVVIKWSHQIQEIVEKDFVQPLLSGLHSNPQTELDFWMMRRENLSCVYDQVSRQFLHISQVHCRIWFLEHCFLITLTV